MTEAARATLGGCRHNMGVDRGEDCGQRAKWHVRYSGRFANYTILACDAHLGQALRPSVINGEIVEPSDFGSPQIHEVTLGSDCTRDLEEPIWWVDTINRCVNEEHGVALGVIAYNDGEEWKCGTCGERTNFSHYRTNSDGSIRHDPFGINHAPWPGLKEQIAREILHTPLQPPVGVPSEPCPKWSLGEEHDAHITNARLHEEADYAYSCPGWPGEGKQ